MLDRHTIIIRLIAIAVIVLTFAAMGFLVWKHPTMQEVAVPSYTITLESNLRSSADKNSKIAIVFFGVEQGTDTISDLVNNLPAEAAFSFSPKAENIADKVAELNSLGHEAYLDIVLSSSDFTIEEQLEATEQFAMINGVVLVNRSEDDDIFQLTKKLSDKDLLVIDSADVVIDKYFSASEVDEKIAMAELLAIEKKEILIAAHPTPYTVEAIKKWLADFGSKDLELIPLSTLMLEENNDEK